jgi:hypothetical protein
MGNESRRDWLNLTLLAFERRAEFKAQLCGRGNAIGASIRLHQPLQGRPDFLHLLSVSAHGEGARFLPFFVLDQPIP